MITKTMLRATVISAVLSYSSFTQADGLSDLKEALKNLTGEAPLSALVESYYTEKRGKKKKQKTKSGLIQVSLSESSHGFNLSYDQETLTKLDVESSEKEQNEEAQTPTLNALDGVGVDEMRNMLSAAPNLLRFINKAQFLNEESIEHDSQKIRQLNFDLPLEAIIENKEVHEYVDDFSGKLHIKIDDQGVPIESSIFFEGNGSAYIFFSMDLTQSSQNFYTLVKDRLVNVKKTFEMKRSSTWGDTQSNGYKILIVNPTELNTAANY